MNHEKVKSYLENSSADVNGDAASSRFFERLIVPGLRVDLVETGRVVCTFKIPRRLLNDRKYLHGGAAAVLVGLVSTATECSAGAPYNGITVEANLSFMGTAYAGRLAAGCIQRRKRKLEMDLEAVKRYLEKGSGDGDDNNNNASSIHGFPSRFFETFIMQGLHVDLIEKGRVVCSMKVPQRLLNAGNFLHGGATASLVDLVGSAVIFTYGFASSGVSVEINLSYLDSAYVNEEIEIEAKALRVGKTIAVVSVEFRKKKTGKIVAQGRHTKYLAVAANSKM